MNYTINTISNMEKEIITPNSSVVKVYLKEGVAHKATTHPNILIEELLEVQNILVDMFDADEHMVGATKID